MITKAPGFKSSDGQWHPSLEEAQGKEIEIMMQAAFPAPSNVPGAIAICIIKNKNALIELLTSKPRGADTPPLPGVTDRNQIQLPEIGTGTCSPAGFREWGLNHNINFTGGSKEIAALSKALPHQPTIQNLHDLGKEKLAVFGLTLPNVN